MDALRLLEYNRWANGLITSQIETLPLDKIEESFGGSFGSIRATIVHVIQADWTWLTRFQENHTAEIPPWASYDTSTLIKEWNRIQDDLLITATDLARNPDRTIDFKTRAGQPLIMALTELIAHISHHGSYHRGQIANMIRMIGEKPVGTDYFLFSIQKK